MAKNTELLYKNLKQKYLEVYNESEYLYKENIHIYYDYNYIFALYFYNKYNLFYLCERLSKKIDIYFEKLDNNQVINEEEIELNLDKEFAAMIKNINLIKNEYEQSLIFRSLPMMEEADIEKMNSMFKEILERINPGLIVHDSELKKLWDKSIDSYRHNDLDSLVVCYNEMNDLDLGNVETRKVEIDYEEEIKKYRENIEVLTSKNTYLKNSFPYNQQALLKDEKKIKSKIKEIEEDIELFKKRVNNLEELLADYTNLKRDLIC